METVKDKTEVSSAKKGGKFLTFFLEKEEYGIEILKVQEIIGVMPITNVPKMPPYVKGVINLRGRIIPIIDLRLKLTMPEAPHTEETCFIVVKSRNIFIGIVVDKVSEVLDIADRDIENPPALGSNTDYILGIGKSSDRVKLLLDIDKVLNDEEVKILKEIKQEKI